MPEKLRLNWGLSVDSFSKSGLLFGYFSLIKNVAFLALFKKSRLLQNLAYLFSSYFSPNLIKLVYLLNSYLSPLSTRPITTTAIKSNIFYSNSNWSLL